MALDKQKILSDLGNVMNQLQSADCGCMGKLFNQGQGQAQGNRQCMPSHGYGGCCRRGYGHPCCGEPYTMGEGMPAHGRPCMGYACNAPKLYADGYNCLNQSVMQPVIKEVYDDLNSLNSGNTVTNNPLGAQMGLTPGVPTLPSEGNMNQNPQMANMKAHSAGQNMTRGHPMMQHMQNYQMAGGHQMAGAHQMASGQHVTGGQQMFGEQQVSGGGGQHISGGQHMSRNANGLANFNKMFPGITQGEGGGLSFNPMEIAMQMNPALAKQQPGMEARNPMSGTGGEMPSAHASAMQPGMNAANLAGSQAPQGYQAQSNLSSQGMAGSGQQPQLVYSADTQNQLPSNFPPQGMNQNTHMGRMANQGGQRGNYGQHTAGITKFKEMFPGVMEGDVNFDPMEIAIQMNPANKQAAAMSSMQKLMSAKPLQPNSAVMMPVMNGMNAVNANLAANQAAPDTQAQPQPDLETGQVPPDEQQQLAAEQPASQQQYTTNQVPPNQQYTTNQVPPNQQHAANPAPQQPSHLQQPQQIYTAVTDNHGFQQVPHHGAQQINQEKTPEPKSQGYPNQATGGRVYEREPILPADNARYNTIGQPIELLPPKKYRMPEPNLPQTLSPQPVSSKSRVNNNVKSTISKTSLYAKQAGQRTPSRAQLQQVYNQYKGSQSYTTQNIPKMDPARGQTTSDGRLTGVPVTEKTPIPVERVGGDTIANNQAHGDPVKGHVVNQVGDASNKPAPADLSPTKSGNLRNGLQDQVFTSYPQSTAWSFHGRSDQIPMQISRLRA